jgi:hypothetical protein
MRRGLAAATAAATATAVATVTTLAAIGAVIPGSASAAEGGPGSRPSTARTEATRALATAERVVAGDAPRVDGSMALLELRQTMQALGPAQRRHAAELLARPTNQDDLYGFAYRAKAQKTCSGHICVHWVSKTRDAATARFATKMLHLMNHVWTFEVGRLGYHRPISDGTKGGGGSGMFDVYLLDLFHRGYYGVTEAEQRTSYNRHLYSSYLMLDNDFARSQYDAPPMQVAQVTAAHEFFHAVQDAYDAREDHWLMESTATWMEDQYDDSSNDNRQYLPWSQLRKPGTPLDTYDSASFEQYGNWVFFEYLSEHFGRGVVKAVWKNAASFRGGGHQYSAAALRTALRTHGGLTGVFARYASGNTAPAHSYAEGSHYPSARPTTTVTLDRASPSTTWTPYRVRHLASVDVKAVPGGDLTGKGWSLRVEVDGPAGSTMPAAVVLTQRRHRPPATARVHLGRAGHGSVVVPFGTASTKGVVVTLANASTQFRCHTGGGYSCNGTSKAPHPTFRLRLHATHH